MSKSRGMVGGRGDTRNVMVFIRFNETDGL